MRFRCSQKNRLKNGKNQHLERIKWKKRPAFFTHGLIVSFLVHPDVSQPLPLTVDVLLPASSGGHPRTTSSGGVTRSRVRAGAPLGDGRAGEAVDHPAVVESRVGGQVPDWAACSGAGGSRGGDAGEHGDLGSSPVALLGVDRVVKVVTVWKKRESFE